ncbi:MAG: ATP-binding domain-containing protein, partial [Bacillus sp. (in: firmicutes)]
IVVSFEGAEATYTRQDLQQITHSYCCSVHKSQGSEFPIVILPVVRSYYRMLRRNLLYTAITRSKQFLILCGEEEALRVGISRSDEQERLTTLRMKLEKDIAIHNESKSEKGTIQNAEEHLLSIDPMIGMEGITPYSFMGS